MAEKKDNRYIEAVGRRKTAIARVRITPAAKASVTVNDKTLEEYFPTDTLRNVVVDPFKTAESAGHFAVTVHILGGGISSQAEAVRHGIARALVKNDEMLRSSLKHEGFLKRDPREKERRKFGLRKARRAPQWSKR
jgi:small subunit ribosomal protein S9